MLNRVCLFFGIGAEAIEQLPALAYPLHPVLVTQPVKAQLLTLAEEGFAMLRGCGLPSVTFPWCPDLHSIFTHLTSRHDSSHSTIYTEPSNLSGVTRVAKSCHSTLCNLLPVP